MNTTTFKALSDTTRRRILRMLREEDLSAGEIVSRFEISGPSISHHLSILTQAELVLRERKGQKIIYSLNTTVFQDILEWIMELKGELPHE